MKRIVISGGGTAGHINPALNIAAELKKNGWEIQYIGNRNSLEEKLVGKHGYSFHPVNIQKLYRRITIAHFKFPFLLVYSIFRCLNIFKKLKPDAFLGTGGFACGPAGFAAHLLKIPLFLQEQNSFPGLTTRILSRWADCIFLGNLKAEKYLNHAATIYTGNPLSEKILQLNKNFEPGEIGLKPDTKKIFLVGGSQGSFFLNKMLAAIAKDLLNKGIEIIWQTGSYSHKHFYNRFSTTRGIYIFDYSHQIAELYKICDLVIARAGALSLAELETLRIPSLLVPLPTAAENHQYYNALELKEKRVAEIIEQKDLTPEKLFRNICLMLEKLDDYKTNFGSSPHGEAALKIASYINNHTGGKA